MTVSRYRTKKGQKWQVRFNYTDKRTRERLQIQRQGFETKEMAKRFEAELVRRYASDGVLRPSKITVREHCEEWLEVIKANRKPVTWLDYKTQLAAYVYPSLGETALKDLTHEHVQTWVNNLRRVGGGHGGQQFKGQHLAPKTVKSVHGTLHAALAHAARHGRIAQNPADYVKLPKKAKSVKTAYSEAQVAALFDACKNDVRWYGIIRLLLTSGMRRGEMLGLRWDMVNLDEGFAVVSQNRTKHGIGSPKSDAGVRSYSFDIETAEALRRLRDLQTVEAIALGDAWRGIIGFVCSEPNGKPLGLSILKRRFQAAAKKAGLPVLTLHESRHTAISAAAKYLSPASNMRRAGHSSLKQTEQYVHVHDGHDKEGVQKMADSIDRLRNSGK